VRQSTPRQVIENRESTELQYRLVDRAKELGWRSDRVLVIDDDLGQSGRTTEHRVGFQWLMAEVGLNHVGLVLGVEMSRLSRSCKDWHQLLELCTVFRTLLADHDRQYDPCDYSDRLLLGLSGIMSEAELHILRNRMDRGRRNKAGRGELFSHMPIGYVRLPSGEVVLDPDEQARSVVRLIFEKFEELSSGRQLIKYLLDHEIRLPVRCHYGPNRAQLQWHSPSGPTVYGMLRHPAYAGAYCFGRQIVDPRRRKPRRSYSGRVRVPMDQWQVLIHDQLPAYIRWEQFLANQERLKRNRAGFDTLGAPREGSALLGGLVRCGKCGWRMYVAYPNKDSGRYVCMHDAALAGRCEGQNFAARVLDDLVSRQVLLAIEPAALELSLRVQDDLCREHERLAEHWRQKLERARYETERLRRQYDVVEPENRLVARELERSWEKALAEEQKAKEGHARFQAEWSGGLSTQDRERIRALSSHIPAIWDSPSTTNQERQAIVRQLIEHVAATVQGNSEIVDATIHWAGRFVGQHQIIRPVGRYEQLRDYDRLVARLSELRATGYTNREIADLLNDEGFHTPKCDQRFDAPLVQRLTSRCGLPSRRKADTNAENPLEEHEWWVPDLAREVGVPYSTIRNWCYRGWIRTRVVTWNGRRRVLWADEDEIDRLHRLRDHPHPPRDVPYPSELTTPKKPPKQ
jgi:DNA invertase Pin-like site-specific DNA recombinase/DNA-binding transcriptional MerR regulator